MDDAGFLCLQYKYDLPNVYPNMSSLILRNKGIIELSVAYTYSYYSKLIYNNLVLVSLAHTDVASRTFIYAGTSFRYKLLQFSLASVW